MPITATTPKLIRQAVITAIDGMLNDSDENGDDTWFYFDETTGDSLGGRRSYVVFNDPKSHRRPTEGNAIFGGTDTADWLYNMHIRVAYANMAPTEWQDMAMADHKSLYELLHPRSASGGALQIDGLLSFEGDGEGPAMDLYLAPKDGGPIYDHIFAVHYMGEHDRNG